jgi:hypothetical protein
MFCNKNIRMRTVKQYIEMGMFVVLNDDAEHSDQTGGGKVESAST